MPGLEAQSQSRRMQENSNTPLRRDRLNFDQGLLKILLHLTDALICMKAPLPPCFRLFRW